MLPCLTQSSYVLKLNLHWPLFGEDLAVYLKHFHENALACCDPVVKDNLVDVCANRMIDDYRICFKNLFSRVVDVARQNNGLLKG